jgi:hypothetical protein
MFTSACATFPPRNPDGSLNVPVLLTYAQYGIDADCQLGSGGLATDVCTFGTDILTLAKSKDPKDVKKVLVDAETKQPKIAPYIDWLIALL